MDTLVGDGNDATVAEEQLLDRCIVRGIPLISTHVASVGSILLQLGAIEGCDSTLESYEKA